MPNEAELIERGRAHLKGNGAVFTDIMSDAELLKLGRELEAAESE
ncbi:hypothetical protein ACFWY5_29645 [Nonomuraea sp. NPDC059007]